VLLAKIIAAHWLLVRGYTVPRASNDALRLDFLNLLELSFGFYFIGFLSCTLQYLLDSFVERLFWLTIFNLLLVQILNKLRVHIAIRVNGILAERRSIQHHLGFEYCLLLLLRHSTSKQISWVKFSNAAVSVLLFNSDNNFAFSLLFGHLLVSIISFCLVLVIVVVFQQSLLEFFVCEHTVGLLGNKHIFLFLVLIVSSCLRIFKRSAALH